jgi:hypothetical protein
MQPSSYGVPPPPSSGTSRPTGKALLSASWRMLRQDRELVWLPAVGSVAGLLAAAILFVPGWFLGAAIGGAHDNSWSGVLGGVLAVFGATIVGIYFQAALVIGANIRADGGDPTFGGCLRSAWALRGPIVRWGLLTATVGIAIRAIEERFGFIGSILGFLGGLAWAIASFLVVPVLVAEDLGPIESVKRSSHLIKATWGTSLRTTLRYGFMQFALTVVPVAAMVVGAIAVDSGSTAGTVIGVVLVLAGAAGFLVLAMVFAAIGSYARALIYRYASGRPVPGIDPRLFAGVFQPKRRRRRFA